MGQRFACRIVASVAACAAVLALAPAPAAAAGNGAIGYAYLKYLEDDAGSVPLGVWLSLHGVNSTSLELDLAYHRDEVDEIDLTVNTFTGLAGLRFSRAADGGGTTPFLRVLGGARHDRIEGESNTAYGGAAGVGVDVRAGSLGLRLGADFQIFFDEGENVKSLRLNVGLTF
jgi:hypothetical protein